MSKSFKTVLLSCLMASLCACSGKNGAANTCAAFLPVYINGTDAISDATARPILSNNEAGHKLCDWEYSSGSVESIPDTHIGTMTN